MRIERATGKCFRNASTTEGTWSSGESLLLLARCTGGLGVPSVARSNLKTATKYDTRLAVASDFLIPSEKLVNYSNVRYS